MYYFKSFLFKSLSIAWIICLFIFILDGRVCAQVPEEPFDLFFLYTDQAYYLQQVLYSEATTSPSVIVGTTPGEISPLPGEKITYDPFEESPIKALIYVKDLYSDEIFTRLSNYPEWDPLLDHYLIMYCNPFLYIEDDMGTILSLPFDLSSEIEKNDDKEKANIVWINRKYQLTFKDSADVDWIKFPLIGKGVWELELTPFFLSDPNISPFIVSTYGNLSTQPQFENFSSHIDEGYNGYLSYSGHMINYNAWGGWVYIRIVPHSDYIFTDNRSFPLKYYLQIKYKNYFDDISIWERDPGRDLSWYHITPSLRSGHFPAICMTQFLGRVISSVGTGVSGITLTLTRGENFETTVISGGDGYFLFSPISSDFSDLEYELKVGDNTSTCTVIAECGTIPLNADEYECLIINNDSFLDPDGDEDGDGIPNSRERIIGTNPLQFDILFDKGLNLFRYPLWIADSEEFIDLRSIITDASIVRGILIDPYDTPSSMWQKYYDLSTQIPVTNKSGGIIYCEKEKAFGVPAEYGINYLDLFDPSSKDYNPYFPSMINLYEGMNMLGLFGFKDAYGIVHPIGEEKFSSFSFLNSLKSSLKENNPGIITNFDDRDGKWQSSYSFFSRTSGEEYDLKVNKSYLIIMNKDKEIKNWVPGSF
ncbi:MAG: hypothetical protein ACMUJM_09095 [bacterium]